VLSLRELERAAAILRREIVGHRVQQIVQTDATSVALELYGGGEAAGRRRWLVLSCDPERARVGMTREAPAASGTAPRFAQFLRAHLRGARVRSVELQGGERELALRAQGEQEWTLLLAIFGRRSNVVVLDAEGRIAQALRPLADTRPELAQGGPWQQPGRCRAPGRTASRLSPTRTISPRSRRTTPSARARTARTTCAGASRGHCARR
jgi:predicted ribosome quality control (RQC) complex YloA/Tae2 family protein